VLGLSNFSPGFQKLLLLVFRITVASVHMYVINPLTPELNPSAQRCLMRFFTGNFAS
jgi:hypothetical protein